MFISHFNYGFFLNYKEKQGRQYLEKLPKLLSKHWGKYSFQFPVFD